MNLFVYSDESGIFDYQHYDYFVFGGIILLDQNEKTLLVSRYRNIENKLRVLSQSIDITSKKILITNSTELKASLLKNKYKKMLYNTIKHTHKFGVIINQKELKQKNIFNSKRTKQRFLDYAFKIALKKALVNLDRNQYISLNDINNIYVNVDEHSVSTDGIYELKETLYSEFKYGTYNYDYSIHFPAIISNLKSLEVKYLDSKTQPLIRASDIWANKIYHKALDNKIISNTDYTHIINLP